MVADLDSASCRGAAGTEPRPGYDSRPRGRGGERRAATRVGGAAAQGRRRRGGDRRPLHVRRDGLARADPVRPAAPRRAGDAHARPGARPRRRPPVVADRHVPVLRRPRAHRHRLERHRRDRVPRARVGAHVPRRGGPRAPARTAEADRLAAAGRRRAAGDLDDPLVRRHVAGDLRLPRRGSHGRRGLGHQLQRPRAVRPAARVARRAGAGARDRLRLAQRDARGAAHPLHGGARHHHRRPADPALRRAAARRAVLLDADALDPLPRPLAERQPARVADRQGGAVAVVRVAARTAQAGGGGGPRRGARAARRGVAAGGRRGGRRARHAQAQAQAQVASSRPGPHSPRSTSGPRRAGRGERAHRALESEQEATGERKHMADGATLDQELGELLEQETFPPPDGFREHAVVSDPSLYETAEADLEGFWAERAGDLHWFEPWEQVLDWSNPPFAKWFVGGKLNVSYNCLDRHVEAGRGERVAFHWRGEEGEERDVTYAELLADVQRFANALKDRGIGPGDVVGIFLPMIPEVAVAMLACARIGAVHNLVFGGFSPESVRERMEFSEAKALITVDGARRKGRTAPIKSAVDEVMPDLPCIVVRHTDVDAPMADKDAWFHELMEAADAECPAEPLDAEHPLFILYTSGSTAKPKGILHTTGGYLTQVAYTHKAVFDLKPDEDVYWCSADVGWVTGHSYIVYGPLANGATSVMYEGAPDYPDKDIWWELCERYGVTIFYTAPTAIRACIKWGTEYPERHDLSALRLLGTVGEPINPKAWLWYHKVIGGERCPIVDTWWQTETGGIMITTLPGIVPTKPGSAGTPLPGIEAAVVNEGHEDAGT